MNRGKTIKELRNRLDIVYPSSTYTSNDIRNDGINYWKGKKIISAKQWNKIYDKNSTITDNYKMTLTSRQPLQYFPDDFNGPISSIGVGEELTEEIQKWNTEYYDLLEFRKNPTLGRNKCSKCLLSGFFDDPLFVGIEKVFARIVSDICNEINNNTLNLSAYPCKVMNFFKCPFEGKDEHTNSNYSNYPFSIEDLFALQRISFVIEQAISTFLETTRNNEIIYQVDFEKDRVQEIHTNYYGEPYSWEWQDNVKEQLSKVKPLISTTIQIRNEQDIYDILTNKEKLESLLQEYENNKLNHQDERLQQVCCDENTPCVPNDERNSNNEEVISSISTTIESLAGLKKQQQQLH